MDYKAFELLAPYFYDQSSAHAFYQKVSQAENRLSGMYVKVRDVSTLSEIISEAEAFRFPPREPADLGSDFLKEWHDRCNMGTARKRRAKREAKKARKLGRRLEAHYA